MLLPPFLTALAFILINSNADQQLGYITQLHRAFRADDNRVSGAHILLKGTYFSYVSHIIEELSFSSFQEALFSLLRGLASRQSTLLALF